MRVTEAAKLQFFWQDPSISEEFRSGVSLHSHTMYSEESLDFLAPYMARVPWLGREIERHQTEYNCKNSTHLDFGQAFWTTPLAPRQAYRLEEKQIQRKFQLPALISITDHDDIRAGTMLRVLERFRSAPVSTEWTVPFGPTFFHLGLHNVPVNDATGIVAELTRFTAVPSDEKLAGLLEMLNAYPDLLIVLNHPLWDEKGIGMSNHGRVLARLLERYGRHFHALELNGLRSWTENKHVIGLGTQTDLPVISGGDRHGREPNAILNLSRAANFIEFVHEVRHRRLSHVVFMPQYREPLKLRILQTVIDILREYPENFQGRRSWADRVFYRDPVGAAPVPLASIWNGKGPGIVRLFMTAMRLLEWRGVRSALRFALDDRSRASLLSSRLHERGCP